MKQISHCQLYTFIDTLYLAGRGPADLARHLCDGGADVVQLRAKNSTREELLRMAEAILPVTRAAGVPLVINDDLVVAQQIGAEYCHLGQEDFFNAGRRQVSDLFRANEPVVRIGLSSHSPEQAARALAAGAEYLGVGPVYPTGTKPEARPVTLDYVRWAAANVKIPWFAIGGVNLKTLDQVVAAGAKRICVVSAILDTADVAGACREFKRRLPPL
ncbi:MAG TPA: thiamine phosphate synthase [Clostridia bacterium]|nr:thiamine phosphate synthase [Clostridia bacterium]